MGDNSIPGDDTRSWEPAEEGESAGLPQALPPVRERIQGLTRYVPLECLGRGGMGEVWAVYDERLRRRVALKLVSVEQRAPDGSRRLLEEAQMTASLAHPNIVPVYDAGQLHDGSIYYTMQEVVGINLHQALVGLHAGVEAASVTPHRVIDALTCVARALGVAHARGLVHRDIKPGNIVIGANDAVYLVDWGIAAALEDVGMVGGLGGTPGFMAPEVETGQGHPSPRSDVYAFGVTLAAALTGRLDRPSERSAVRLDGIMAVESLLELARVCMHPDPAQRPESAAAVVAWLEDWAVGDRDQRNRLRRVQQADALVRTLSSEQRRRVDWILRSMLDANGRPTPCRLELDDVLGDMLGLLDGVVIQRDDDQRWILVDPLLVEHWAPLRQIAKDTDGCALQVQVRAVLPLAGAVGELSDETLLELLRWQERTGAWLHPRHQAAVDVALADRRQKQLYRGAAGMAAVVILVLTAVVLAGLYVQAEQSRRSATDALAVAREAHKTAEARRLEAVGRASWMGGQEWTAMVQLLASHRQRPRSDDALLQQLASQPDALRVVPVSDAIQWWIDAAPDGQTLAVAGDDGRVRLVDSRTGQVTTVDVFDEMVPYVRFLDNATVMAMDRQGGRRLISVSEGRAVSADPTMIAVSTSPALKVMRSAPAVVTLRAADGTESSVSLDAPVQWAEVSEDGGVVVLTDDGVLHRWSDGTAQSPVSVSGLTGARTVAVSPSGRRAVVFDSTADAWVVALDTGRRLGRLRDRVPDRIRDFQCRFGSTSELLACGSLDGRVLLFDLEDGALRWSTDLSGAEVWQARPSPDGAWVAAAADEGFTAVLDARSGSVVTRTRESGNRHKSIAWMPDGESVAIATAGGQALLWTPPLMLLAPVDPCEDQRVNRVAVDARGDGVYRTDEGEICGQAQQVWDGAGWVLGTRDGSISLDGTMQQGVWMRRRADGSVDKVPVAELDCDARQLVASGSVLYAHCADRSLRRFSESDAWQVLDGVYSVIQVLSEDRVLGLEAGTSDVLLIDTVADRVVKQWSSGELALAQWLGVAVSPDQTFYGSTPDGVLSQWNLDDGEGAVVARVGQGRLRLTVSPDGQWLGVSDQTGMVEVRATAAPADALWRYDSGEDAALGVQFLADWVVVSDGSASALVVLDRATGASLLRLPGLRKAAAVARRPDGRVGVALIPQQSDHQDLFLVLEALPEVSIEGLLSRTNLRLCPTTGEAVPVIPFPSPDSLHAPERSCSAPPAPQATLPARPD